MKESEVGYALTLNGFVQCEPQLKGIAMDVANRFVCVSRRAQECNIFCNVIYLKRAQVGPNIPQLSFCTHFFIRCDYAWYRLIPVEVVAGIWYKYRARGPMYTNDV